MNALAPKILEAVKKAQTSDIQFEELYKNDQPVGKNEFLFFIKPELTTADNLDKILEIIFAKISEFGLTIHNAQILGASYLDKHNIIGQHYGVISALAQDLHGNISQAAKEKFKNEFGVAFEDATVMGGLEFLKKFPDMNAFSMDLLWQNKDNHRLGGGTHCKEFKVDDGVIHVVNGFLPRMLTHFTAKGRSIIVMTLSGDLDWKTARNDFIGLTNPADANAGSVRRTFLDKQEELGLADVSQGMNGVHLSAGPVEAAIELVRYNSDFGNKAASKTTKDFSFGKALYQNFDEKTVEKIISNPNIDVDGKSISVFDLTEEKNTDESVELLKKHF